MSSKSPAPSQPQQPVTRSRGRLRPWLAPILAAAAVVAAIAWFGRAAEPVPAAAAAPPAGRQFFGRIDSGASSAPPAGRSARRHALAQNYRLAEHTYCSYREGSRYPAGSRPIAENSDQTWPNAPVTEMNPMRLEGGGTDPKVQLQTSQSRVYLASGEAVAFSMRAVDEGGRVLALVVTRALAVGVDFGASRGPAQVALAFGDDGSGADPVAGDGAFSALLAPGQSALAGFHGTIRTEVLYSVGGKAGRVTFDVIYSPELPATWTGQIREANENGSLNFYLKAEVREPGRYIVTGRVDDARGKPFALVSFNDLLGPGPNEVKLTMFGKLLRDGDTALPLTLRDVDGYLLKENTDPDRALMPRLEGKTYVSKSYPLKNFSDAEWQSEERTRHLTEFARDLKQARADLSAFDPGQALPPSECNPVPPQRNGED